MKKEQKKKLLRHVDSRTPSSEDPVQSELRLKKTDRWAEEPDARPQLRSLCFRAGGLVDDPCQKIYWPP